MCISYPQSTYPKNFPLASSSVHVVVFSSTRKKKEERKTEREMDDHETM